MKILYLKREHGRPFFYADPSQVQPPATDPGAPRAEKGWVARKWESIDSWWREGDGAVARWSRRTWDRLNAWTRPDEALLIGLRSADAILVRHPASIPTRKARSAWKRYLARRARSHLLWLIVDGVLSPITGLVCWILPGPNVIFFWFSYRAYNHYLIVRAVHHARWSPPPTTFEADPDLDRAVDGPDGPPGPPTVEDPDHLRRFLERGQPEAHDADHEPDSPAGSGLQPAREA